MTRNEEYTNVRKDYLPRRDIFSEDRPRVAKSKSAIAKLSASDQAIFIHYCEDRSLQKLANRFGVSKAFMCKTIKRIREEIKKNI